jgi:hypothetical protein
LRNPNKKLSISNFDIHPPLSLVNATFPHRDTFTARDRVLAKCREKGWRPKVGVDVKPSDFALEEILESHGVLTVTVSGNTFPYGAGEEELES